MVVFKVLISPIVTLWFKQEELEGNFRCGHMSLRTNAESVAFYKGESLEGTINEKRLTYTIANKWKIATRMIFLNCKAYPLYN
jgi:putative ATP-binding cassette transporter